MKKLLLVSAILASTTLAMPAFAQAHAPHAVGNLYTKALNMIESGGGLDLLDPKKHVQITDMHIDHGQVHVAISSDSGATTLIYDPMVNKMVSPVQEIPKNQ